jgi:hypothetical protein
MTSSQLLLKTATILIAALVATSALAEDMSLPGPSGDCLSRATSQLSIDTANCVGRYPVGTQLYGQCITDAHLAYASRVNFCVNVSGAKLGALRLNEANTGKKTVPMRR